MKIKDQPFLITETLLFFSVIQCTGIIIDCSSELFVTVSQVSIVAYGPFLYVQGCMQVECSHHKQWVGNSLCISGDKFRWVNHCGGVHTEHQQNYQHPGHQILRVLSLLQSPSQHRCGAVSADTGQGQNHSFAIFGQCVFIIS